MALTSLAAGGQRASFFARWAGVLGWSVTALLLVFGFFTFPLLPAQDLEISWRMALGYFFEHGLQFGRDVVFTYGPLGFVVGKAFSGLQFWSLLSGQLLLAVISAGTVMFQGRRLPLVPRLLFFVFFLLFGPAIEDFLHILIISLLGFELLRLVEQPRPWSIGLIGIVLAVYAEFKFTEFLFTAFIVLVALVYGLTQGRRREAVCLAIAYAGVFCTVWLACGQNLLNLPTYFLSSWQLSNGYQAAMALPAQPEPLWKGLVLLAVVAGYAGLHLIINPRKLRAAANTLLLAAFVFLQWKHGFIRSDEHMLGFFFCALMVFLCYPALLDDPDRLRLTHRYVFAGAIMLGVWGVNEVLYGFVWMSGPVIQQKIIGNIDAVVHWNKTELRYRDSLESARRHSDLPLTRAIVGEAALDVLGHEQGVALLNRFNYRPRPVFQSYCVFTPALTKINGDFYSSDRAPDFVLMKMQAIDGRLPAMDDALAFLLLAYRYEFLLTEKNFTLWQIKPGPFDRVHIERKPLRSITLSINHSLNIADLAGQPLWLKIDLQPTLLGKIRQFLYKLPPVTLRIQDDTGRTHDWPLPLPQGESGFVISPMMEDQTDFLRFARNQLGKPVQSIAIKIAPADARFFAATAQVKFFALPVSTANGSVRPSLD